MKKVFLTLVMLLFAFTGVMRADEVTIGSLDGAGNNSYLPMNSLYNYSYTQQIYTAEEIGTAGTINSITMWLYGNANLYEMPFDIYMVETDKAAFTSTTDWLAVTAADIVYSGSVTVHNTEAEAYTFTLDTPFEYSGDGNLLIAFNNTTGNWKSGLNGKVFGDPESDAMMAIYVRQDGSAYDPTNPNFTATATTYARNVVTLDITAGAGGVAGSLTVHDGTTTNAYVPVYGFYADAYLKCEMVYPAAELADMAGADINAITFASSTANVNWGTPDFQVFVTEVPAATISAFAGPGTVVYEGALSIVDGEMVVNFTTPYNYGGGNLLVGVYLTNNATYVTSTWLGETVEGASVQGYSYSSLDAVSPGQRNFLPKTKFDYVIPPTPATPLATNPEVLDLGYRPNGAWMAPYVFTLKSNIGNVNVTALDFSGNYFTNNVEVPVTISGNSPLEIALTTGEATAGEVNSVMTVIYGQNRDAMQFDVTATAYDPAEGDVFEEAIEVPALEAQTPYTTAFPAGMYKNYELPVVTDAADAVYELNFDEDVLLYAGAQTGNVVLYAQDFNGEDGPMADNNYEYNGPVAAPGPISEWLTYPVSGSYYSYGTGVAGNPFYWGYRFTPENWADYTTCSLVEVETFFPRTTENGVLTLNIYKGGETAPQTLVATKSIQTNGRGYYNIVLDSPVYFGNENIWVTYYNDDMQYPSYIGYTGSNPDGFWSSDDGETWASYAGSYGYVIYCHFMELPVGDAMANAVSFNGRKGNGGAKLGEETELQGTPKAQLAQNNRGSRDGWTPDFDAEIDGMYVPAGTYYLVAADDETAEINIAIDAIPAPEQAIVLAPMDGETNVEYPYVAEWILGDYTAEMQVLFGTEYPPQTALIEWTTELVSGIVLPQLEPNQSYFLQVNERNAAGVTEGEIIAFTTPIDPVEGFEVASDKLYPGDAAEFTWEANSRSLKGYNLYQDGVKVNETPITATEYAVEGLEYNMAGYDFQVAAVYDAGESVLSDAITVKMTGNGTVSGTVFDTDSTVVVPNATVEFSGIDEHGANQVFTFTTDENGMYTGELLAGTYTASMATEGYDATPVENVAIAYDALTPDVNIFTHEFYYPLGQITATEQVEENNVLVEWSWDPAEMFVDFETGDFSQAEFILPAQYPWTVTTTNPYEGTYCMKSTCEGVASATSSIEVTVDVPFEAKMGFYVRTSTEANWDKFYFYIDGIQQGTDLSGANPYAYKEYSVSEGTHTYKWAYTKDSSVNSNDDCVYVDNITMYRKDVPAPPIQGATVYDFEDQTMMGWTSIDADGDGRGWVSSADPGIYHNSGVTLAGTGHDASQGYVISGSYSNSAGIALTPDNYLVSPTQISAEDGALVSFYVCAQDASYAAEHFGVAVSTGAAAAADFTTIQEWTLTAKSNSAAEDRNNTIRGTRAQGSWYNYTVDLSSYAGQDIWVAIRHFNCTDMFILNLDDITLADGSAKPMVRNDRTFQSFNLYRRNNIDAASVANPELIAEGINGDVFEYIDEEWATLPYGEWQWGIQATYDGYAVEPEPEYVRDATADDCGTHTTAATAREMWDLLYEFDATSGYQYGIASDGDYIYTSSWSASSTSMFYKYDMEGNFIEEFNISGCGQLRGMTYDGQYFYGVANSSTIYCVDLANHTLVSTITSAYGAQRAIGYDPERDGFWVVGNWSGNLTLVNRSGAVVTTGPAPTSASDVVYYKDVDDVEHVYCFNNGTNEVYDYNIATNTIASTPVFTVEGASITGSSGGCFVGTYDDKTCFFADIQQSPQHICIYELNAASVPPTPPTPGPVGEGQSEILWSNVLEKDMEATLTFNVGLNNGQNPDGATVTIDGENNDYNATIADGTAEVVVRKGDTYDITVALDGYTPWNPTGNPILVEADATYDIVLQEIIAPVEGLYVSPTGWARWEGAIAGGGTTPTPPTPPTPGGQWYQYGSDEMYTGIGAGGAFYWAIMFPAGSYEGNTVTKVANYGAHDDYYGANGAFTGTVTIYNDGTTTPATAVGTMDISMPDTDELVEFEFPTPVTIDPTKNLWIVFYNASSTDYVASACVDAGDANARWVSLDGSSWMDLATAGVTGASWMIKVYVASGAKGEVHEISVPTQTCNNAGVLSMQEKSTRAALSYKVMLDGEYLGETYYPFYQLPVEGMEEGSEHVTAVAPLYASGMGDWMEYPWTYTACSHFDDVLDFTGEAGENGTVNLSWTLPEGGTPTPPSGNTTFTESFEGGLNGWNVLKIKADGGEWLHSDDNLGGYVYTTHAHTGTGFAMCYSYVDYDGPYDTDCYMYTPEKYSIVNGSTLHFFADNANDSYPENFSVCVSTVDNPTSSADFTQVWSGGAKGRGNGGAAVRHNDDRYDNWREHTIDLSAYAGQDVWIAFHDVNYDMYEIWIDDVELTAGTKGSRDMWDYVFSFNAAEGGHYGVAYDGENFYTSNWGYSSAAHNFYKYDLEGNMIEGFEISGCGTLRGMTYDGEYFYGVANSSTIYCVDLANHALVSTTTSAYGAMRGITYDPERDGFWVIGNWSGNLTLVDRTGAIVQTGATPTSASDLAYYKDADGVEHVYCFNNGTNDVDDYNIGTNTITSAVFNFSSCPGFNSGSSGGCTVGVYDGKTCFIGDIQQSPNLIGIYELDASAPVPPTPGPATEGILGVVLFRDGEYVDFVPSNVTTYTDNTANEEGGEYTYTVRVVYDGDPDVTFWAMSCGDDVTVTVQPWAVGEVSVNTLVYPNPTNGTVTIEAQGMTHITVVNTIGQVVYDADIDADMTQLNLGQFNAGLYLIRINSEAGISVERVTVVK